MVEIESLNVFGDGSELHDLGVGVGSIKKVSADAVTFDASGQKVRVAFVKMNGMTIELVGVNSPVCRSIREGVKLLHLCYTVPDIELAPKRSQRFGFGRIQGPVPAVAFENRRIAWVLSLEYGLIELFEQHPPQHGES